MLLCDMPPFCYGKGQMQSLIFHFKRDHFVLYHRTPISFTNIKDFQSFVRFLSHSLTCKSLTNMWRYCYFLLTSRNQHNIINIMDQHYIIWNRNLIKIPTDYIIYKAREFFTLEIIREGILLVLLAESKLLLVSFTNMIPEKKYFPDQ